MKSRIICVFLLLAILFSAASTLVACGNKGALYLPKPPQTDEDADKAAKKKK